MKILYVYGLSTEKNIVQTLRKLQCDVMEYPEVQDTSNMDEEKINALVAYVKEHGITHLMSIHLIYNVAVAAYWAGIKYISVIWDAPYLKAYTVMGTLDNIWYSAFDKLDAERMRQGGCPHVMYQPLSVNRENILAWKKRFLAKRRYIHDISLIANLYEDNAYDRCLDLLPENMQAYFRSIFEEAAFKWDGVNRVYGKTGQEILEYMKLVSPTLKINNPYNVEDVRYFEAMYLIRKLANIERVCVLNLLAEDHDVYLYTYSEVDETLMPKVHRRPPVQVGEATSFIYAGTKINLNIALKGIEGGTTQRIMDIMGAGGFVLTNYCEETAELFEEDKEIVMFRTPEELIQKVDYYLEHEEEREQIARAGHEKAMNDYTYEKKIKRLLDWVTEDEGGV
jgi:spore maturation protein CgeB|nr:glycosyltransferase [uncultured Schaedlerella sp.]